MLSTETSDTGLLSATGCQFPNNATPGVQRSPEPLRFVFVTSECVHRVGRNSSAAARSPSRSSLADYCQ